MLDSNLLVTFAKPQDQPVLATSNTTHRLIDVTTAQMDNSQVTATLVETRTTKTVDVLLQHKTVPQATQSNSPNNNAIDARLVMLDKLLSTTDVQSDQLVLAISNTTHRLTDVTTAQSDNWEMLTPTDVHNSTKHVMQTVEFNWPNNNAISARTAQQDNNLLVTFAESQDQLAVATSNTTHKLTDVTLAQQVNSPTTVKAPKTTDAKPSTNHVAETTQFN